MAVWSGEPAYNLPARRTLARQMGYYWYHEPAYETPSRRVLAVALGLDPESAEQSATLGRTQQGINLALKTHTVSPVTFYRNTGTIHWHRPPWTLPTTFRVERGTVPPGQSLVQFANWTVLARNHTGTSFSDPDYDATVLTWYRITCVTEVGDSRSIILQVPVQIDPGYSRSWIKDVGFRDTWRTIEFRSGPAFPQEWPHWPGPYGGFATYHAQGVYAQAYIGPIGYHGRRIWRSGYSGDLLYPGQILYPKEWTGDILYPGTIEWQKEFHRTTVWRGVEGLDFPQVDWTTGLDYIATYGQDELFRSYTGYTAAFEAFRIYAGQPPFPVEFVGDAFYTALERYVRSYTSYHIRNSAVSFHSEWAAPRTSIERYTGRVTFSGIETFTKETAYESEQRFVRGLVYTLEDDFTGDVPYSAEVPFVGSIAYHADELFGEDVDWIGEIPYEAAIVFEGGDPPNEYIGRIFWHGPAFFTGEPIEYPVEVSFIGVESYRTRETWIAEDVFSGGGEGVPTSYASEDDFPGEIVYQVPADFLGQYTGSLPFLRAWNANEFAGWTRFTSEWVGKRPDLVAFEGPIGFTGPAGVVNYSGQIDYSAVYSTVWTRNLDRTATSVVEYSGYQEVAKERIAEYSILSNFAGVVPVDYGTIERYEGFRSQNYVSFGFYSGDLFTPFLGTYGGNYSGEFTTFSIFAVGPIESLHEINRTITQIAPGRFSGTLRYRVNFDPGHRARTGVSSEVRTLTTENQPSREDTESDLSSQLQILQRAFQIRSSQIEWSGLFAGAYSGEYGGEIQRDYKGTGFWLGTRSNVRSSLEFYHGELAAMFTGPLHFSASYVGHYNRQRTRTSRGLQIFHGEIDYAADYERAWTREALFFTTDATGEYTTFSPFLGIGEFIDVTYGGQYDREAFIGDQVGYGKIYDAGGTRTSAYGGVEEFSVPETFIGELSFVSEGEQSYVREIGWTMELEYGAEDVEFTRLQTYIGGLGVYGQEVDFVGAGIFRGIPPDAAFEGAAEEYSGLVGYPDILFWARGTIFARSLEYVSLQTFLGGDIWTTAETFPGYHEFVVGDVYVGLAEFVKTGYYTAGQVSVSAEAFDAEYEGETLPWIGSYVGTREYVGTHDWVSERTSAETWASLATYEQEYRGQVEYISEYGAPARWLGVKPFLAGYTSNVGWIGEEQAYEGVYRGLVAYS